ncbi:hypothetical protein BGZ80_003734 [Entomortierella chlamydospora]|uniref:Uncharacterized protein n=1 Tax=Entomortierella chlamydospora TaxID=101097 RepID=A0A9P6N0T4_9FUNG|nr:hypothetical protein BGZ79_008703 [Entomortierella chlamydospora]KAG0020724.1 hypothetical protein BGZ80_003734 [Entomortierella chlamydospora]
MSQSMSTSPTLVPTATTSLLPIVDTTPALEGLHHRSFRINRRAIGGSRGGGSIGGSHGGIGSRPPSIHPEEPAPIIPYTGTSNPGRVYGGSSGTGGMSKNAATATKAQKKFSLFFIVLTILPTIINSL